MPKIDNTPSSPNYLNTAVCTLNEKLSECSLDVDETQALL
jgi:hypothetical protein